MASNPDFPRLTTQPKRRQTKLDQSKGANADDAPGTDINKIVAQYRRSGTMPAVPTRNPLYGDFTGPADYHQAQEQLSLAQDRYNELPADIRTASENNPEVFLAMFEDPDQRALLESAGLIITQPEPSNPPPPASGTPPTTAINPVPTTSDTPPTVNPTNPTPTPTTPQ